jgi:hypothetical protein
VRINGQDALSYRPPTPAGKSKPKKPPRVSYSREFEEIEAYTAMGMSHSEYEALPGIPYWTNEDQPLSKSHVIAWARYHVCIENLRTGIF